MTKRRSDRARTMGQEILDRSGAADDAEPETPLTGASKATSPPREATRPQPEGEDGDEGRQRSSG